MGFTFYSSVHTSCTIAYFTAVGTFLNGVAYADYPAYRLDRLHQAGFIEGYACRMVADISKEITLPG